MYNFNSFYETIFNIYLPLPFNNQIETLENYTKTNTILCLVEDYRLTISVRIVPKYM